MPSLTFAEATARAGLLRAHGYEIILDVSAAPDSAVFASTTKISFSCTQPGAESFVELKPAALTEVRLNGEQIDPASLTGNRLWLRGLGTENELVVRADMSYSNTGEGLHRFTDPEDGEVYLYAQTFLDDAQRIFACFDQPDLKAPVTLTVIAPPDWTVLANGPVTRDGSTPGEVADSDRPDVAARRWEFATTAPLATYFMTVVAGPYHSRYQTHDGIPLGLHCRRSLAPHLDKDAEEMFEVTRQCLDRYHELFGVRYPFGKYDQAFVPEFNAGAMENPGCVTFRDELIFRSAVTRSMRETRAMVIAHEMAHMWFGDLVTLRWWDDIWLNESFAEYMGFRVTVEATQFTEGWTAFTIGRKNAGYAADQRPSTHPVAPESVDNTALALLNFDGISYPKGASVLRQLAAWVGDEAFLAGLRAYFDAYAYGNASLADLLAALSTSSGRDLAGWAEAWLRRPQVNTLRPEVTYRPDGSYAEVAVVQTAPEGYPTLRPHRIGVGLYARSAEAVVSTGTASGVVAPGDAVVLRRRAQVDLDPATDGGRTAVADLAGQPAGDLLVVNDGDLTFAKIRFDERSHAALPAVLPALHDSLTRALVWSAAADATRDAELPAPEFIALAAAGLPTEGNVSIFEDTVRFTRTQAIDRFLPDAAQPAARATVAAACAAAMATAEPASSRQLAAAQACISLAGPSDVEWLTGWLAGTGVPAGLGIDTDLRWQILRRLVVLGAAGEQRISEEQQRDPSSHGAEEAAACRAALPEPRAKERAWQIVVADETLSNRLVAAAAAGFWQPEQTALTGEYVPRYFAEMPAMMARRTPQVGYQVAMMAYPRLAVAAGTLVEAERMLARDDLDPGLRRVVVDLTDDLRRGVAARAATV